MVPDTFERARLFVFDTLQRADPWESPKDLVRIADIDDESLKHLGQWPWPRSVIAELVRTLQDQGAKAIAFDVVFAEADRTSPARLVNEWEQSFGWKAPANAVAVLPDYDQDLATAFARGRVVTGFSLVAEDNHVSPAVNTSIATIGGDPAATVLSFRGAIPNIPALDASAAGAGSFAIPAGRDQMIRTMPLLLAFNAQLVPSLALETIRVAEDEDTIKVRVDRNGGPGSPVTGYTIRIGDYDVPLGVDGSFLLHHGPPRPESFIPVWRLLDPDQRASLAPDIKGHIVIIGTSAVGLSDLRSTAFNPLVPGVALHARAIEQILSQHFLTRPAWASGIEFTFSTLLATILVGLASWVGLRSAVVSMAACCVALIFGTWLSFVWGGTLIDPSLALLTLMCSGITAILARYFIADRDASRLRAAFTHYLAPALVDALAKDPERLQLGGEQREMTFLFTDLEGFTSLIESVDPQLIVSLLNSYLDELCSIAMDHGGTVDKIVGDAMHVIFNAPLDQPDHAERAVRCALAIDVFAQRYAADQKARGLHFGVTRIGINTGTAIVGNFGGSRRFDYTAHGDAINTAARLETANKALGTRICVARSTAAKVNGLDFLPVGTLMLKGKSQGVDVFIPQPGEGEAGIWNAAYLEAFARFSDGDEAAAEMLVSLHELYPDHPILALHARRIRAGERSMRMAA